MLCDKNGFYGFIYIINIEYDSYYIILGLEFLFSVFISTTVYTFRVDYFFLWNCWSGRGPSQPAPKFVGNILAFILNLVKDS